MYTQLKNKEEGMKEKDRMIHAFMRKYVRLIDERKWDYAFEYYLTLLAFGLTEEIIKELELIGRYAAEIRREE